MAFTDNYRVYNAEDYRVYNAEDERYEDVRSKIATLEAEKTTLYNTKIALVVENQNLCQKIVELEGKVRELTGTK